MKKCLIAGCLMLCAGLAVYAGYAFLHDSRSDTAAVSEASESRGDMVCGPRCAQFLLKHYGKDTDLIELVKEIQWPEFEAGASLQAIDSALQKRGVYTQAIKMDPEATLCWPHPVLLHLNGSGTMGHYIVWLPESSEEAVCAWVGLEGVRRGPNEKLARQLSGVVLLTSPVPITSSAEEAVREPMLLRRIVSWNTGLVVALSVAGALFLSFGVRRLRLAGGRRFFLSFSQTKWSVSQITSWLPGSFPYAAEAAKKCGDARFGQSSMSCRVNFQAKGRGDRLLNSSYNAKRTRTASSVAKSFGVSTFL
jgi:hypothetical protein